MGTDGYRDKVRKALAVQHISSTLSKDCKQCGLTMKGTYSVTNPANIMWLHPDLKACAMVKPVNPTKGNPT